MVGELGASSFWEKEKNETQNGAASEWNHRARGPGLPRESSHNFGLFEMAPLRAGREDIVLRHTGHPPNITGEEEGMPDR